LGGRAGSLGCSVQRRIPRRSRSAAPRARSRRHPDPRSSAGWILWHLVRQKPAECSLAAANGRSVVMVRPSRTHTRGASHGSARPCGRSCHRNDRSGLRVLSDSCTSCSSIFSLVLPGQHAAIAPNCQPIPSDIRLRKGCRLRSSSIADAAVVAGGAGHRPAARLEVVVCGAWSLSSFSSSRAPLGRLFKPHRLHRRHRPLTPGACGPTSTTTASPTWPLASPKTNPVASLARSMCCTAQRAG
jgi:hypothetical protein